MLALQRAIGNAAMAALLARDPVAQRSDIPEVQRSTAQEVLRGSGQPLAGPIRAEMEARMGADFSTVRVHTGAEAEESATELGARAYTSGEHIVLGAGGRDRHTLAHELHHVIQQRSGPVAGTDNGAGLAVSDPSDSFERAAEESARQALSEPVPVQAALAPEVHPHAEHSVGGHRHGRPIQRARITDIQSGLNSAQVNRIMERLQNLSLIVPVVLPEGSMPTRSQARNAGRQIDSRLHPVNDREGFAEITWDQLIRGDVIRMAYGSLDVYVRPHSGSVLGAAVDDLRGLMSDSEVTNDPDLGGFTTALMQWLVRQRSNSSGNVEVATHATTSDDGSGTRITIGGRPGWDDRANQIVTGYDEDRRHIIAWHTMRDAFLNVFNTALADGEDIRGRMRRLIEVLERTETWASLDEAEEGDTASTGGSDTMSGVIGADQPSPSTSAMDLDTPPRASSASPVPNSPVDSMSDTGSTTSEQLRSNLTATVTRVLNLLSNNPFNLWAGESLANQSINRVRQQLVSRLGEYSDDSELLNQARARAEQGAETQNEDQMVWTRVRDTLENVQASDARKFIQSIADSFDVDIPVTGGDETSSTYGSLADQAAVVRNVLATGLAQEVLAMSDNQLPSDFDTVIAQMEDWLRRFLRPEHLQTTVTGGRRTVGAAP
ncbi:DUF4157 domain-containing protein [Planosporangium sp. 12N6]|uniref:eCIS core domain-containing protein n=1 Tax=Planosporangium spinosum TaxID=3402278 RepID=UPI003CFB256F